MAATSSSAAIWITVTVSPSTAPIAAASSPSRSSPTEEIRVELDQLWDLLRQRRALRDAGQDPDSAEPRSAGTVENYWQ